MKTKDRALILGLLVVTALGVSIFLRSQAYSTMNGEFRPPNSVQRSRAVGPLDGVSPELKAAFNPADDAFAPIPKPEPSDWLANHQEIGQSFVQYQRSRPNRPDKTRTTIYLQPLGDFDATDGPSLDRIKEYASAFFDMPVVILPPVGDQGLPVAERTNNGVRQLLSTDILNWLQPRVPENGYCLLAVTMTDLYPDPKWNYVFGQASLRERVGVYSFVRYSPAFWGEEKTKKTDSLMLRRSCNVLAHETGHMFGIKHCIHYHCVMNGSNHLAESDSQPNHLCPVCLRKLHHACEFDVEKRYINLSEFSQSAGWSDEKDWLNRRINTIAHSR